MAVTCRFWPRGFGRSNDHTVLPILVWCVLPKRHLNWSKMRVERICAMVFIRFVHRPMVPGWPLYYLEEHAAAINEGVEDSWCVAAKRPWFYSFGHVRTCYFQLWPNLEELYSLLIYRMISSKNDKYILCSNSAVALYRYSLLAQFFVISFRIRYCCSSLFNVLIGIAACLS
jgi:hypothetical protein